MGKASVIESVLKIKEALESHRAAAGDFGACRVAVFEKHLYQPLVYCSDKTVEVHPVALNESEVNFVDDLSKFCSEQAGFFRDKELYLLRNASRGRGVSFFEADNFYPDFILWLIADGKEHVTFVDPHGLMHSGKDDPKVKLAKSIKEKEARLGRADIVLNSIILSPTSRSVIKSLWCVTDQELAAANILFQADDRGTYVSAIFDIITRP
jgi:hypothetical protein